MQPFTRRCWVQSWSRSVHVSTVVLQSSLRPATSLPLGTRWSMYHQDRLPGLRYLVLLYVGVDLRREINLIDFWVDNKFSG